MASPVEWLADELASLTKRFEAAQGARHCTLPSTEASRTALRSLAHLETMLQGPSVFLQRLTVEV